MSVYMDLKYPACACIQYTYCIICRAAAPVSALFGCVPAPGIWDIRIR
jgi:hypothetical protein